MTQVLELRDIVKDYPGHRAVDGVSLALERGKLYSLLGPSGCGKTTTLRLVGGFELPTSGEVWLNGELVNSVPPHRRNVSTVFQNYALFPHLTALENVEFGLRERRQPNARAQAMEALDRVQLKARAGNRPAQLSGGEKQRVALARSLVLQPDLLLLDEPLAALDPNLRRHMRAELKELQRATGITFLLITHDREEALSMSDQVTVMNRGRIEQSGTPQQLYRSPATRFVAEFLGSVNWFGAVGVRPEHTSVTRARSADSARAGAVTSLLFLGNSLQVHARLTDGTAVISDLPAGTELAEGETVWIDWNRTDEMRVR
ncbi:MAG: transporter related [Bryobacterales bacterium]|nr:transporter related [Bryobacterales bacterium]